MPINSTYFMHKWIHLQTWHSTDEHTPNQMDYCLIDARHFSDVIDVMARRGTNIDSDQILVVIKLRVRMCKKVEVRQNSPFTRPWPAQSCSTEVKRGCCPKGRRNQSGVTYFGHLQCFWKINWAQNLLKVVEFNSVKKINHNVGLCNPSNFLFYHLTEHTLIFLKSKLINDLNSQ
jgi:hypothetical protein